MGRTLGWKQAAGFQHCKQLYGGVFFLKGCNEFCVSLKSFCRRVGGFLKRVPPACPSVKTDQL